MMKHLVLALLVMLSMGTLLRADDAKPAPADVPSVEKQTAQIRAAEPALVIVEYTVQYDKGDAPTGGGFLGKCPLCGNVHMDDLGDIIRDERPWNAPAS